MWTHPKKFGDSWLHHQVYHIPTHYSTPLIPLNKIIIFRIQWNQDIKNIIFPLIFKFQVHTSRDKLYILYNEIINWLFRHLRHFQTYWFFFLFWNKRCSTNDALCTYRITAVLISAHLTKIWLRKSPNCPSTDLNVWALFISQRSLQHQRL